MGEFVVIDQIQAWSLTRFRIELDNWVVKIKSFLGSRTPLQWLVLGLISTMLPMAYVAPHAQAAQRTLIIDVVNVGWTGKLNNETYVSGQANQLKEVAIPYLNSVMTGQVKFEFGKYYPGPVLLDRQLSCDFTDVEFGRIIAQTGIPRKGHYVFAFSPKNDCGYNSYSNLGTLENTEVTWFTSTVNNYGAFFRPMLWGAGLASSGTTQCFKGTNTDDGWAGSSCKYSSRGNPHDVTGEQEAGFNSLWISKRIIGTINNVFQRWQLGDFVESNLYESWKKSEQVTLSRSDSKSGLLGVFIGGKNRYWVEYRRSTLGVSGVAIYRHGQPGTDANNYVTFLQSAGTGPEAAFSNGLMQKNELFVSEDKNVRIIINDLNAQSATLTISRENSPSKEVISGTIDPSGSLINSRLNLQGESDAMPVVEINIQGPISMKLSRTKRYPMEPYDYQTPLPNSPVWGVIGSTTSFDVVQKSISDPNVVGSFSATGTYADGTTVNLSSLVRDSVQAKRAADQLAAERAAAAKKAAEQAEIERLITERLAAERIAEEQRIAAEIAASKKKTITCVKGKTTRKVTGTNPKCPSGFKIKK
jgi:hypothetical protein